MTRDKIRECPFCGCNAEIIRQMEGSNVMGVKCSNAHCEAGIFYLHAVKSAIKAWNTRSQDRRIEVLEEALKDMLAGWKYIREMHGDLYGVGWDRAQGKAEQALEGENRDQTGS